MPTAFLTKAADGGLDVRLHAGQERAFDSLARFLLVLAGSQGGKTVFGPYWLQAEIAKHSNPATIPDGEYDDYIAASANYPLLSVKMLPALKALFCQRLGWTWHGTDRHFVHPSGKVRILVLSADAQGGLESSTAKAAWLDEWGLPTVGIECWEAVQRRLAIHSGRVLITTTPYCLNWIKTVFYDRWKGGDSNYDVVQFANVDNPAYPAAEYKRLKETLPDWKFRMMCHGELTRPAGMIYEGYEDGYAEFSPIAGIAGPGVYVGGGNLVKAFTVPFTWMRDVGIDFGESANCARLWVAEDPTTHFGYVFRDQLGGGLNGPEYAKDVLDYHEDIRIAAGGAKSEQERRDQWARAGLAVAEPLIWEVEAGIDHANALFKTRRWFVFDTCVRLRSELGSYSRELDASGEPTAKIADKAKAHELDAARYIASYWPQARPEVTMPSPWTARAEDSNDREKEILERRGGKWY
jgi:hypothetical protein